MEIEEAMQRVLEGTMLGDSLGLPAEGMSKKTIARRGWKGNWQQRLIFGKGMLSDDSEQSFMLGAALLESAGDPLRFQKIFARKLKYWLMACPAGIGFGTLRALLKLWCFVPPSKSGVWSAGNGAAMRCALLGVYFHDDEVKRKDYTKLSTELTHRDPKALFGAKAVVESTAFLFNLQGGEFQANEYFSILKSFGDEEWGGLIEGLEQAFSEGLSVEEYASRLGCEKGVSGYVYQTVPVALYAVLRNYCDFEKTLFDVLDLGGDTDTVGAITGAMAAVANSEDLPQEALEGIAEWPRSRSKYNELAKDLCRAKKGESLEEVWRYPLLGILLRNFIFTIIVLAHGFRRILPF